MGAAPLRLAGLARGLRQAGHEVLVVTGYPHYPTGRFYPQGQWARRQELEGISIRRHWAYPSHSTHWWLRLLTMWSLPLSVWGAWSEVRRFGPEVVIVQSPPPVLPLIGWLWARLLAARLIVNFSDLWPEALEDLGAVRPGLTRSLLAWIQRSLCGAADLVLVQSEEAAAHLAGWARGPVKLYRAGTDTRRFGDRRLPLRRPGDPLRMVSIGVMGYAQGLSELCQRIDFGQWGVELHLYGAGLDEEALRTLAGNRQGLVVHAPVPPEEVPSVLDRYDVAFISLRGHIRGTVPARLYEAMAAGLPVLLHGSGEAATLIRAHRCGLCAGDEAELGAQLAVMAQASAAQWQAWAAAGQAAARKYFDRADQVRMVLDILEGWAACPNIYQKKN